MSKEQINELAKDIYSMIRSDNMSRALASLLYDKGWRTQSENTVEVVRCKDCKFNVANMEKDALDITDYSGDDIVCSYFMTDGLAPTDFCSYGVKMKG